ncbi:DUF1294 domain-containing protein [Leptolyngbya sp. NK1-12]|uniref:DUF1294 domain-containing protein n=1 Tax=Leptolyngbya sp. NK1-12 TaxID=2547451 RepID=A0AA96WFJ5_9CYAN|nr:DUF1294 domain-containing protein [Leptolyngbya sp. NK1-12]WNZ24114.1 DUF1294 domain-containing protein [Leptolyngbya sp. NK1-12]
MAKDPKANSRQSVLHRGQLIEWQDKRGFGFIKPDDGSRRVFLHICDLKESTRRPQVGDVIYYQLGQDRDGKQRACHAFIEGARVKPWLRVSELERHLSQSLPRPALALELVLLSCLPVLGSAHFWWVTANPIPLVLYPLMSGLTFALYAHDKSRARQGKWRVSENTLHLCELLGGWLGALIAQRRLHHKSRKRSYQLIFWTIVIFHLAFWCHWLFLRKVPMR